MAEVVFYGESFEAADEVGEFALMEFAEAAERVDTESLAGMAAVMRLVRASLAESEWPRFQKVARTNRASVEACMALVMDVFERETDRPTSRPSDSSDGPRIIEPKSEGDSSSRVIARLEAKGRPDLAFVARQAQAARSA